MARKSESGYNIYHRNDGRWEGRYPTGTENGKTSYIYVYGKTFEEAGEKLEMIAAAAKSQMPQNAFANIAQEWLEFKEESLKPSSIATYTNVVNKYLIPAFGDRDISDITRADCCALVSDLQENGVEEEQENKEEEEEEKAEEKAEEEEEDTGLSTSSIRVIMTVCVNIFHYASREKGISVADIEGIPIKKVKKKKIPKTLSKADLEKLITWLSKNLSPCSLGILLCLTTGMRLGEICALQWKDISKKDQSISVYKTMQRIKCRQRQNGRKTEVVIQAPKSDSSNRQIAVTEDIGKLLEACRQSDDAYVLTGEEDQYMEPRKLQRRFQKVLKDCGLENINFHALRHTFATCGVEVGFDYKTLCDTLVHADVSTTLNFYVHPTLEQKKKNMELFPKMPAIQQAADRWKKSGGTGQKDKRQSSSDLAVRKLKSQ